MPTDGAAPATTESGVDPSRRVPPWMIRAIAIFWSGLLVVGLIRHLWDRLDGLILLIVISLFLSFAIEPGVNRLARRGWKRGRATGLLLFGVVVVVVGFFVAMGALVAGQVVDLLQNTETYIVDTVDRVNDTFGTNLDPQEVIEEWNDPAGPVQQFINAQSDNAVALSWAALGGLLDTFTVLLFTFYLVADGPRVRGMICSRLRPDRQVQVLEVWELAIVKTGGYLYSRLLLAALSAFLHWVVFQSVGIDAPIPLALWVGVVSQFLPVVGTYMAGVLPVALTFLDSPVKAAIVLAFIVLYQQIENYVFAPRITARTMELHPAVAFGSALAGIAVLGVSGAILALPAAAMLQAIGSGWGTRHELVVSELIDDLIDDEP